MDALSRSHLSQRGFAEKLGHANAGFVNYVVKGTRKIPPDQIETWAAALKWDSIAQRQIFIDTAREEHSHAGLVKENNDRGREIDRLKTMLKELERLLLSPKPETDAAIRRRYASASRDDLLDEVVKLHRQNHALIAAGHHRPRKSERGLRGTL